MFKVCFNSHHFASPEVLLQTILKMTPKRSGAWKDMVAVTNHEEADYVVHLDGINNIRASESKSLYFAQHPKGIPAYRSLTEHKLRYPNDTHLNPGEWWISYDYDTLSALDPPRKTKKLISITTYKHSDRPTYSHRIRYLEEYVKLSPHIDIYGRQEARFNNNKILKNFYRGVAGISEKDLNVKLGDHIIGKDIEIDYRYALDFDHGKIEDGLPVHNYFSERFYDSMLLWTMPLYFGSDNVHEFVPKDSFVYVDIVNPQTVEKAVAVVNSDFREQHIAEMKEARELLLNKYQLWPFVYSAIKAL